MWAAVVGYEGLYEVSTYGEVRRVEGVNSRGYYQRARILKQTRNKSGHWYVSLHNNGQKSYTVHRLVAEAHIPNPNNLPLVRHLNDDTNDNSVSNLSWGTKRDNYTDALRNGKLVHKEFCKYGHRRTPENLSKIGACRECNKIRSSKWRNHSGKTHTK